MITLLLRNLSNLKEFHQSDSLSPEKNKIKFPDLAGETPVIAEASVKELGAVINTDGKSHLKVLKYTSIHSFNYRSCYPDPIQVKSRDGNDIKNSKVGIHLLKELGRMGMLLPFLTVGLKLSENFLKISYLFRILGRVSRFFKKYLIITVYNDSLHKNIIQNLSGFEIKYIKINFMKPQWLEMLF